MKLLLDIAYLKPLYLEIFDSVQARRKLILLVGFVIYYMFNASKN